MPAGKKKQGKKTGMGGGSATPPTPPTIPSGAQPPAQPPLPPIIQRVQTQTEVEDVKTYPLLYWFALGGLAALWFLLGLIFIGQTFNAVGYEWNTELLIWIFGILHFAAGIRVIDANRIGGIFVLGWPTCQITGQLLCVPPGLLWMKDEEILTKEMEIPAEPENIWREEAAPPADRPNLRPPIRITFAEGKDKDDPLQRRVTEEVSFFVRLRIEKFFNFYVRIGEMNEAKHQLEDVGVSYLAEVLPGHTLSEAIKKVGDYSGQLKERLVEATIGWGAKVVTARVKQFPFSRSLNAAIQKMAEETAGKRAAIIKAEGEKQKLTLEGKGAANAVQAGIDARTNGYKKMAKDLGVHGKDVLGVETARAIGGSESTKIIVGTGGFADLIGAGVAIADTVKGSPAKTPTSAPSQGGAPGAMPPATPGDSS